MKTPAPAMTDDERLAGLTFHGPQMIHGKIWCFLFTDPLTGSTFGVEPDESIVEGFHKWKADWDRAATVGAA